jgi:hypothetical protein
MCDPGVENQIRWAAHTVSETVVDSSLRGKLDFSASKITKLVPRLQKFCPRVFSSVRTVCAALSSKALPNLKKVFLREPDGLDLAQFTRVIFTQLCVTHPSVMDPTEAPTTIALIQDMFAQIGIVIVCFLIFVCEIQ